MITMIRLLLAILVSLIYGFYGAVITVLSLVSASFWTVFPKKPEEWLFGIIFVGIVVLLCIGIYKNSKNIKKFFGITGIRLACAMLSWAIAFLIGVTLCVDFVLFNWVLGWESILLQEPLWLAGVLVLFALAIAVMMLVIPGERSVSLTREVRGV